MIAKIMAVGRDRRMAVRRLRRALDEVEATGIHTTLPFDRALVRDPAFLDEDGASLSTDWVAERWDGAADRRRALDVAAVAAAEAERMADVGRMAGATQASLRKDIISRSDWRRTGRDTALDRWPR